MILSGHPAWRAWLVEFGDEFTLAQLLVRRAGAGYELRHQRDADEPADRLRLLAHDAVRPLAQFTPDGTFRPLRSAPSLAAGWRLPVADQDALPGVLDEFYPGALADWFAAQQSPAPVTDYPAFAARQTGLYRGLAELPAIALTAVVAAVCAPAACAKRRLWTAPGLPPDAPSAKSVIPCLEPCALLLDGARRARQAAKTAAATAAAGPDLPLAAPVLPGI